ncbi:MAG: Ig-like domain-containing protein, partial [Thermoplasmata archaeon]
MLLLSAVVVLLPGTASAFVWTEDTDTDFNNGTFTNTEVVGTGAGASVQLKKDIFNWIKMGPPPDPGEREGPGYCFDEVGGVMVIFGGYGPGGYKNDTWEYDYASNTWTQIVTNPTPPSREWPGMAYDSTNEVCVLFGGMNSSGVLKDTWEYDVNTNSWEETSPFFGPKEMFSSPLAFDSSAAKTIMVGMDFATEDMETWAYDASLDSWTFQVAHGISDRSGHAMAYDASRDKIVVFGGSYLLTVLGDTWEFDYATKSWTDFGTGGPAPRFSHAMAYDSTANVVYLFGGRDGLSRFSDTHKREGTSWSVVGVGTSPDARDSTTLVYDTVNGYVIMCCGYDGSQRFNDTWVLGQSYQLMGIYTSGVYDTGDANVNYTAIYLNQSEGMWPPDTEIRIRIATSINQGGPWSFVGPDGTVGTWYNQSSTPIPAFHDHQRYIRYSANLISWNGKYTPQLDNVAISYTVDPSPPYLSETYPVNAQLSVPTDTCIWLNFSEPMKTTSVTVDIWYLNPKEDPGITFDWTWMNGDTTLRLCPQTQFQESRAVQVWVNGTDLDDMALIPNPIDPLVANPFVFVTAGFPPYVLSTNPAHQQEGVPDNANVVITWSEPMDNASVNWTIQVGTDPGGWMESWSGGDTILTLSHANPFTECEWLEFNITEAKDKGGKDFEPLMGAPVPWQFRVACLSPYVVSTDPYDGMPNVELNYPITIEFSEPMNPSTLSHHITPSVTLSPTWTNFDQTLIVNHGLFSEGVTYTYCIDYVEDKDAYPLLDLSYCFSFTTISNNPYIFSTTPADGDTEVSPYQNITVAFSEAMNTNSVTWTMTPNVPNKAFWTTRWDLDKVLWLEHVQPMLYCAQYTFEITGGTDPSGNSLIPGPVPNPWSFNTTYVFPCVMSSVPVHNATGVSQWAEISITFDEPIDKATFSFSVDGEQPGTNWTETWSNGDKTVTLNHSKKLYPNYWVVVDVTSANDLDGNPLKPSTYPEPFRFQTVPDPNWPWIVATDPAQGEQFVETSRPITIWFSETMDTATVTWDVQDMGGPSPIAFTPVWSQTNFPDDTLTLTHTDPFNECDIYFVLMDGQDLDGNPLQPVNNPWSFETICVEPVIMSTDPPDGDVNVPLNKSIVIDFSEEMQPASLVWSILPDSGGWTETWSNNNWTVTLNHSNDFAQCTIHTVQVTQARDLDNNNIIPGPVPNPWTFTTECINPYIVSTDPYDGEVDVPLDYNVTVIFSEPMDNASVVFQIMPGLPFNYVWTNNDTVLTITHTDPFIECQLYNAGISDGTDKDGNPLIPGPSPVPNPWVFTTVCINPWVVSHYPPNGGMDIPLDAPLIINFSESMSTPTVSIDVSPNPGGWGSKEWSWNESSLWWNHSLNYTTCTTVTVTIQSGQDKVGLDLIPLPYVWTFMTECPNPYIVWTDPYHGEINVELTRDIQIEFSDPMDTPTVSWAISPDPGGWTTAWYSNDTLLVLSHSNDFQPDTIYTVQVTGGKDKDGFDLISGPVQNPWQFKTGSVTPPHVDWTDPTNGQLNVGLWADVIIHFDKEINPGTFHWNFTMGANPGGWTKSWSQIVEPNDTVTLSHSNPFTEQTSYCIRVEHAKDIFGQDLEFGPYEFCFGTTSILPPPGGLTVTKVGGLVHLTWNLVTGATHYNIYDSTDRFADFSSWNVNQVAHPTNTYDFSHLGDGLNHYYIVRAYDNIGSEESVNSTMGVKIEKAFTISPMQANIYWMSLPFISEYSTAS